MGDSLQPSSDQWTDPSIAFEERRKVWLARCPCPIPLPPSPTLSTSGADDLTAAMDIPDTSLGSEAGGLQLSHMSPTTSGPLSMSSDGLEPLGPAMDPSASATGGRRPSNGRHFSNGHHPTDGHAVMPPATSPRLGRDRAVSSPPVPCSDELLRSPAFGPMALLSSALEQGSREAEIAADAIVGKLAAGNKLKTRVKLSLIVRCYYSHWLRDGTIPSDYASEPPLEDVEAADAKGPPSSSYGTPMPPGTPVGRTIVVK